MIEPAQDRCPHCGRGPLLLELVDLIVEVSRELEIRPDDGRDSLLRAAVRDAAATLRPILGDESDTVGCG